MDDGDISDWDSGNFDDSVSLGFSAGQTDTAAEIITELQKIIKGEIKWAPSNKSCFNERIT